MTNTKKNWKKRNVYIHLDKILSKYQNVKMISPQLIKKGGSFDISQKNVNILSYNLKNCAHEKVKHEILPEENMDIVK